jgi:hypothetical protein
MAEMGREGKWKNGWSRSFLLGSARKTSWNQWDAQTLRKQDAKNENGVILIV